MREQLIQYVELLFAGAPNSTEIKQEILQNTLDRYDDLVDQGKSAEAAYRLAISGIGDINEIIGSEPTYHEPKYEEPVHYTAPEETKENKDRKLKRAVAVAFYILCPVPLFILGDIGSGVMGLCFMFLLIAAATALMIMTSSGKKEAKEEPVYTSPRQELRKSISDMVWAIGLAIYFLVSLLTGAWFITWIIFPIIGSVKGLINACIDLKEASNHEN